MTARRTEGGNAGNGSQSVSSGPLKRTAAHATFRLYGAVSRQDPGIRGPMTNGRYLGDVLTGLCPVEVGRIAGQNDNATGRIRLHLIAVELIAQADVENAGHDCVDSVLRVSVRHQLYAGRPFDPDHVGAGL